MTIYQSLIDSLIESGYLQTPRIIAAFKRMDRKYFVRPDDLQDSYVNSPLSIGHGQTISQPLTVAFMLEQLQPEPGERIVDVGAGSGWTTALLADIVGKDGKVFAIERILEICTFGKANVAKFNFLEKGIVEYFCQNAEPGLPSFAPFDAILVSAALVKIPSAWVDQLKEGGRVLAPFGSDILLLHKVGGAIKERKRWEGFAFVPFIPERNHSF